ncbi:MAG: MFS transporter [Geminicoccaceae bacterium]
MTEPTPFLRRPEVIIAAGCLIALLTFGTRAGFGLYLEPMSSANGWGREIFAVAIGIQNIMWGLGQPIAGALADRFGATRVLIVGTLIYFSGFVLMSFADTPALLHLSAGFLIGIGGAGASFGLVMAAVGRMVPDSKRSMALGIIVASSSLGQFLLVPTGQAFIMAYGWSTALVLTGSLLLFVIPLSAPFSRNDQASGTHIEQTLSQALREASRHRSYVLLTLGFFVCGYHVAFIQTHLPAYIQDQGVDAWVGGWAIALVGLFNIVGSLTSGWLGGFWSKKKLLSLIYLARAIVIAIYVTLPVTATTTLVFAGAMGLLWLSTVPATSGLIALMFGPRYMATLFGIVFLSHQVGAFIGVWLGGYLFDLMGTYNYVWWSGVGLGLVAALLHWPIVERPVARLAPT